METPEEQSVGGQPEHDVAVFLSTSRFVPPCGNRWLSSLRLFFIAGWNNAGGLNHQDHRFFWGATLMNDPFGNYVTLLWQQLHGFLPLKINTEFAIEGKEE